MKKIYLTSIGYKLLAVICTIGMFILTSIIIFLADEFYLIAIVFSVLVTVLCLSVSFLTFNHSISINGKVLIIRQIKTIKIDIKDILDVSMNKSFSTDNVIFIQTKGMTYRLNGFNTLLGQRKKLLKTTEIVMNLREYFELSN